MKKQQAGFTLIELMIVVAIIAILASIAIPAYQNYIKQGKISSLVANYAQAVKMAKSENAKIVAGGVCTSIIDDLNDGGAKAIGDATSDAYFAGAVGAASAGQVAIDGLTAGCPVTGNDVTITVVAAAGSVGTDYPGGVAVPTMTFTPQ